MRYSPSRTNTPPTRRKNGGPPKEAALISQKIAKPPHSRLNGTKRMSARLKTGNRAGPPVHSTRSPGYKSPTSSVMGSDGSSYAHRVPDSLRLEETADSGDVGRAGPVGFGGFGAEDAFDRVRGGAFEVGAEGIGGAGEVEGVDVGVRGEPGGELGGAAGEDVDHAAGDVGGGEDLGEGDRGERAVLAGDDVRGVARGDHRGEHADQAEQRRGLGGED